MSIVQNDREWNHGFFSCFDNCGVCICSCFCPCVQYGRNVRILGNGEFLQHCCLYALCCPVACFCHSSQRTQMREKYQLQEVCINDCVATMPCCAGCALAQVANEIDDRGVPQNTNAPAAQSMH